MDRLAAMRTFVEIVDRGSLTAAADALGRSQPAVVRSLAALEAHLGARLLHRTTRRMSLTPEGRDYLDRCRRILIDVDEAEQVVSQAGGEPRGDLRLAAPIQFGQHHVAPAVNAFLDRHPAVRVELQLLDRIVDLVDEGIDLALRIGTLADSSLVAVRIGAVRRMVCAAPALLERVGRPSHPRDLEALPCVRFRGLTAFGAWPFRDAGHDLTARVDGRFVSNQVSTSIGACVDGLGFGLFLSYQVEAEIRAGRLVPVLEAYEPEVLPVSLVYPGGRLVSLKLRAMIDWLREALPARDVFV